MKYSVLERSRTVVALIRDKVEVLLPVLWVSMLTGVIWMLWANVAMVPPYNGPRIVALSNCI